MTGRFHVEQQVRSGLGEIFWLKAVGPFQDRAMAEAVATRYGTRTGLPTRIVEAPE